MSISPYGLRFEPLECLNAKAERYKWVAIGKRRYSEAPPTGAHTLKKIILSNSLSAKAATVTFFGPGFAPAMIAIALPKAQLFLIKKLQSVNPLGAFPGV